MIIKKYPKLKEKFFINPTGIRVYEERNKGKSKKSL